MRQSADPVGRASIPTDAARNEMRPLIHDLLTKEFADKTPKGKRVLAAALFTRGAATTDDPVGCYELLSESIDVAVESADLDTAMKACGELARRYDVDTPAQKAAVLIQIAPKLTSAMDSASLAAHGILTAQALVHRDGYATAQQLVPIIRTAATASYSPQVQKQVRDKLAVINAACAQYAVASPAITRLKTAPNDPEANLAVGRFECFTRNDFAKGLPLLTKGSNAGLKAAAAADLAGASTGAACRAVGDAWWNQAAKETTDTIAATRCKSRAAFWYRQGVDQLEGLAKAVVQQRLATIPQPNGGNAAGETASTAAPVESSAPHAPRIFDLSAKRSDWSVLCTLPTGFYEIQVAGKVHLHYDEASFIVGPAGRDFEGSRIGNVTIDLNGRMYDLSQDGRDIPNGRALSMSVTGDTAVKMKVNDRTYNDNSGSFSVKIIQRRTPN